MKSARQKKPTQEEIIGYLKEGWELGASSGFSVSVWLQKTLCAGGESHDLNFNTFNALRRKGIIEPLPRRPGDAFWLTRYGLKSTVKGEPK